MERGNILIKNASELVTCSGFSLKKGKEMNDLHIINDGAVIIEEGIIKAVGATQEVLKSISEDDYEVIDASQKTVLPGFVDSHTHFIFGGYRAEEFSWRLRGDSYMEIMNRGGGIINSVKGTKEASKEELIKLGKKRLNSMLSFGVTTVEGKSGYGLDFETEIKQLEVMEELDKIHPLDIVKTFLGAHAVPKEYKGREDEFIDFIIEDVLPIVKKRNLAEFCDIFCEKNVFSVEQSRRLLLKAKEMGMKLKIHADEIVRLGGAELAAEIEAVSADHLLQASDDGIKAMAQRGVVATLLPCTAFSLKEEFARGRYMIDNGCAVALATDFNPGSCFTESIPLVIALATLYMKMSIEETITALTINGAAAIDKADTIGSIDVGKKGDIVIHEFPSYKFLPYHIGVSTVEQVIKNGIMVYDKNKVFDNI
ncbi:imidazolonepropionase [Paramaledivibacter caminithermalis]|jgi:imidazolonepropionase|uniref:Imidazolonepropionase n=1 Tax=Paramaledivibacter caminithermalis (strain DSM 15212 / CIP 107654 / DViRD3) TaxID=1121301 RepID=A0A1M6STE1_PARC5|nr:imidazolonepropionase [Paramaledivibacter caminithermalis]SHK47926.1 imidazolonepropionase [Paramaledivibacter caminithermalis DSM 15212]